MDAWPRNLPRRRLVLCSVPTLHYTYLITNTANGKRYAGYTKLGVSRRWKLHLRQAKSRQNRMLIGSAIRKHGEDSFLVQEVYRGSMEVAIQIERGLIESQQLMNPLFGYNLTEGGEHSVLSPEAVARHRSAMSSPSVRARIAVSSKERMSSPESRQRMRESFRRSWEDPEVRARHRDGLRRAHSRPESKARWSAAARMLWQDPEYRAKTIAAQKAARARKRKLTT